MKRTFAGLCIAFACAVTFCLCGNVTMAQDAQKDAKAKEKVTVVSYYFGNYHVDKRNEARHGKGWTEWELVKNGKPRFEGHNQPHVPLWGYTDEADPKVMAKKIDAAADHGIDVFLFDWYYYNDGPFLDRPIDEGFLNAPNKDRIQFALMWANHDWIDIHPRHKGKPTDLLYPGKVTPEMFDKICDLVIEKYFKQPNYWKIDGKPYFSFYELTKLCENFGSFEATKAALQRFRDKAKAAGFPDVHLNAVYWGRPNIPGDGMVKNPVELIQKLGFDSVTSYVWIHHVGLPHRTTDFNWVRDRYFEHWNRAENSFSIPYIPNASMGWDNNPRADMDCPCSNVIVNNTPENFKTALQMIKDKILSDPKAPRIMNINCWNEWTEGSYLEPDTVNGFKYLEAIRDVFKE